ncbi:MAG: hypothetical protein AUJ49_02720 [Desulfovibrionaceae bacterium CG1_02_65_16]|nr:MAG: hypothetical protein AUJ49_02720 [Desulfovibrionaceae bacterium CG1_02_65_16]
MLRALIIEDAPVNQEFLLQALKPYAESTPTCSGEDGLAAYVRAMREGQPFDVVFLDIMLPGMDGLKTLEHMRAAEEQEELPESSRARVIVTTVLDDDRTASRAFISGRAVSYMTKPFRLRQIRDELGKLGLIDL